MGKLYHSLVATALGLGLLGGRVRAQTTTFGDIAGGENPAGAGAAGALAGTNLATGTVAPALPLLAVPGVAGGAALGLQYTAGAGVRVNDLAGEVGLGWALTGPGAITREVKGLPDDGVRGWFMVDSYRTSLNYTQPQTSGQLPMNTAGNLVTYFKKTYYVDNGFGPAPYGSTDFQMRDYLYWASHAVSYSSYTNGTYTASSGGFFIDTEPDVYTVTLPGGRLQFVFDEVGNPVALQGQSIKIEALNLGARTAQNCLHEFRVTTSDGTQYLFGSPSGDNAFKETFTVNTTVLGQPLSSKDDYTCTYKWLLKKIVYPNGEAVAYGYNAPTGYGFATNNFLVQDYVYSTGPYYDGGGASRLGAYIGSPQVKSNDPAMPNSLWRRKYTVSTRVVSPDCKQLASISTVQGSLELTYQTAVRQDVAGGTHALAGLRLRNKQGTIVKQLQFVQHYATASTLHPDAFYGDSYHLVLDKVIDQGTGCDYIELYKFGYNPTVFCRNSDNKDDWGYLNSDPSQQNSVSVGACARSGPPPANGFSTSFSLPGRDRTPSATYAQAMILQSITTANGGVQSFAYELHDANPTASAGLYAATGPIGGLRIKSTAQFDGISHANDVIDTFSYTTPDNVSSGCWGDRGAYAALQLIHGNPPNTNGQSLTDDQIRGLVPNWVNGQSPDSYYVLRSDASLYQYAGDYVDYRCVVVDHGVKGKTRYEFTSWADVDRQDYADPDCRLRAGKPNPYPSDPYQTTGKPTIVPLPFSLALDGLNLNYAGGGITPGFPGRTSRAPQRGLLTRLTQLGTDNNPVAVTTNTYDFVHAGLTLPVVNALTAKPDLEIFGYSQNFNYFRLYYYQLTPNWCPLIKTTQVVYDQQAAGNAAKTLTNTTEITYANFFPQKTVQYASAAPAAGVTRYATEFRRAQDFAGEADDQTTTPGLLRQAGMLETVVEQESYLDQATANCTKIPKSASFTEYQLQNGAVLPYQTYAARAGLACFAPAYTLRGRYGGWSMMRDPNYELTSTITGYTADNRPVNARGRSGVNQATIWGYGHTLPIATVTNGTATTSATGLLATAAHTSFEEDGLNGTDGDGWAIPAVSVTEAKTGARSARIVIGQSPYGAGKAITFSAGANRHGKMVFSCWVKVPAGTSTPVNVVMVVQGQSPSTGWQGTSYTINPNQDWQYVQTVFDLDYATWTGGLAASDNLTLGVYPWCTSGTELLFDEVRVHRADAIMQTVTYAPLVGKTSSTDASGVTSYYTYDGNNYARLVLNQKHDIVQRTQQHLVGQAARPSADFSTVSTSVLNCPVPFTAAYSTCAAGTSFAWDFGDGTTAWNSSAAQTHSYAQVGTYRVSLLVANQDKGASRLVKTVTIVEAYHTDIQVAGPQNVNLCTTPNPEPTVLTASVPGNCQSATTYQWQMRYGGSSSISTWTNLATTSAVTYTIGVGSVTLRCIVGLAGVGDNSGSPSLQTITLTGTRPKCLQ